MQNTVKKIKDGIEEIVKERFFSPMYFYFIIAWFVTNWKFVYVFGFAESTFSINGEQISKIEYLWSAYPIDTFEHVLMTVIHLFVVPALFSWFAVWKLTSISELFFERYETYQQNKRVISRELEYKEKVRFFNIQREIREAESDKKDLKFEENKTFNAYLDNTQETVMVGGVSMRPSEVLYNTDYEAYKESLKEWQDKPDEYDF